MPRRKQVSERNPIDITSPNTASNPANDSTSPKESAPAENLPNKSATGKGITNKSGKPKPGPAGGVYAKHLKKGEPKEITVQDVADATYPKLKLDLESFLTSEYGKGVIRGAAPAAVPPLIFSAIRSVMQDIAPLAKKHLNEGEAEGEGFWFRKMDEIVNAMQPLMVKHGIIPAPEVLERSREHRPDADGFNQTWTIVKVRWRLYSAFDGSVFPPEAAPCITDGEGMSDTSFSTAAAQTMSMKTALCQLFMVPVFGDDPEAYLGNKTLYVAPKPEFQAPAAVSPSEPVAAPLLPGMEQGTGNKRTRKGKVRPGETAIANAAESEGASSSESLDSTGPSGGPMSSGMIKLIEAELKRHSKDAATVLKHFKVEKWSDLQKSQVGEVTAFISQPVAAKETAPQE